MDGPKIRRLYYSTSDISKIAQVHPNVLRNWEIKFPNLKPSKSKSGRRLFRESDLKLVLMIKKLKDEGCKDESIYRLLHGSSSKKLEKREFILSGNKTDLKVIVSEMKNGLEEILNILSDSNNQAKKESVNHFPFGVGTEDFHKRGDFP